MSDYLWDKTGEADDETKRLEELLGGLKFQPRPLELPALPARTFNAARTRTLLSWPRLAVAASLTAALLLGAWLVIAERRATTNDAPQLAGQKEQPGVTGGQKQSPAVAPKNDGDKQPQSVNDPGETPREGDAAKGPKPRRPDLAGRDERKGTPRANRIEAAKRVTPRLPRTNPERRVEVAQYTAEEIAAAEKVMFALRLTSEKLSYASQQVQDAGRREPNR